MLYTCNLWWCFAAAGGDGYGVFLLFVCFLMLFIGLASSLLRQDRFIEHPLLADSVSPMMELYHEVKRKAFMRLEYENQTKNDAITSPSSQFYNKPQMYAMDHYAYYVCHKCSKVTLVVLFLIPQD